MRSISMEEVEVATFNLAPSKAPIHDGFTSDFFHHCWSVIKMDVWVILQESQRISGVRPALNATFLSLVPKEDNVTDPNKL